MDKPNLVKLPKEVAEAIQNVRDHYKSGCEYDLDFLAREKYGSMGVITMFTNESRGNMMLYFNGLVNGYVVEQTPEDKVREMWGIAGVTERNAIRSTLNALDIKVKGVND